MRRYYFIDENERRSCHWIFCSILLSPFRSQTFATNQVLACSTSCYFFATFSSTYFNFFSFSFSLDSLLAFRSTFLPENHLMLKCIWRDLCFASFEEWRTSHKTKYISSVAFAFNVFYSFFGISHSPLCGWINIKKYANEIVSKFRRHAK